MRRILVIGAGGRLGSALLREYAREFQVAGSRHSQLELGDLARIRSTLEPLEFDLLINCAALTAVDYCESHREEAFRVNAEAPALLAKICRAKAAQLIHFSTDYVFDGKKGEPYTENDEAAPLSVYGRSKLDGERAVLETADGFLVVRVSWVFGPDRPSFLDQVIARAQQTTEVAGIADKISAPTYTLDIGRWLRIAWERNLGGLLHLANAGECSWREYAQHGLDCCRAAGMKLRGTKVAPLKMAEMKNFLARRPVYTVLSTDKFARSTGVEPRSWREAVAEYVTQHVAKHER